MSTEEKGPLEFENISNSEIRAKWGLPDDISPYEVNLEELNPANNDWFGKNLDFEVFKSIYFDCHIYIFATRDPLST